MGKVKKGVKKFQKKIAGGGVHKKKKLHFRRDKAEAAKAAEVQEQSVAAQRKNSGASIAMAAFARQRKRQLELPSESLFVQVHRPCLVLPQSLLSWPSIQAISLRRP